MPGGDGVSGQAVALPSCLWRILLFGAKADGHGDG